MASSAVISTVRSRVSAPLTTASSAVMPWFFSSLNSVTITTPFSTAWPNSAMKPIAADTER